MASELNSTLMTVRYKLVFVGDVGVGKTSIMNRFITEEFSEEYDVKIIIYFNNIFKISFSKNSQQ